MTNSVAGGLTRAVARFLLRRARRPGSVARPAPRLSCGPGVCPRFSRLLLLPAGSPGPVAQRLSRPAGLPGRVLRAASNRTPRHACAVAGIRRETEAKRREEAVSSLLNYLRIRRRRLRRRGSFLRVSSCCDRSCPRASAVAKAMARQARHGHPCAGTPGPARKRAGHLFGSPPSGRLSASPADHIRMWTIRPRTMSHISRESRRIEGRGQDAARSGDGPSSGGGISDPALQRHLKRSGRRSSFAKATDDRQATPLQLG